MQPIEMPLQPSSVWLMKEKSCQRSDPTKWTASKCIRNSTSPQYRFARVPPPRGRGVSSTLETERPRLVSAIRPECTTPHVTSCIAPIPPWTPIWIGVARKESASRASLAALSLPAVAPLKHRPELCRHTPYSSVRVRVTQVVSAVYVDPGVVNDIVKTNHVPAMNSPALWLARLRDPVQRRRVPLRR